MLSKNPKKRPYSFSVIFQQLMQLKKAKPQLFKKVIEKQAMHDNNAEINSKDVVINYR